MDILREAGFDNLSLDWIYGLPGQSEADLYKTAESLLDLAPEHISTYCLSIERGTRFSREHVQPATDDEAARAYMYICETLAASGFDHYELSNFARPGFQARHNLAYWTGAEYLGLGPGASGFVSGYRYRHPARIESYFLRMERAGLHVGRDRINDAEAEYLMLRLRLTKGFSLNEYANLFGIAFADRHGDSLRRMSELGMVEIAEGFLRLTPKAYFVSNSVIVELMD
jgi:oxygen-independent coproporphyrinogen-3 oxidase